MKRPSERRLKRLVVPAALTVATLGATAAIGGALAGIAGLATSAGCDNGSPPDAAADSPPDTPIV